MDSCNKSLTVDQIFDSVYSCPTILPNHLYQAAKMVKRISILYRRKVNINFVPGGRNSDLTAGNKLTFPKFKYDRLNEYISVFRSLISSNIPLNFFGNYYSYTNLTTLSKVPHKLRPELFVAGSSQKCIVAQNGADTLLLRPLPYKSFKNLIETQIEKNISRRSACNYNEN